MAKLTGTKSPILLIRNVAPIMAKPNNNTVTKTKKINTINLALKPFVSVTIADVAVTKRHQRPDEIRIIFTRTSSKSFFLNSKKCHAIYTPST